MKKLISLFLFLCIICSMFMLISCGRVLYWPKINYPEGYTGGFSYHLGDYPQTEYHWVETYDEAVAAMELLKSHGSTFAKTAIFSYEGDLFDTKYCFKIMSNKAEFVQFGEDPFDRKATNVEVMCYGFFEDVTIEELVYSFVEDYNTVSLTETADFDNLYEAGKLDFNSMTYVVEGERTYALSGDKYVFYIDSTNASIADAMFSSIELICVDN